MVAAVAVTQQVELGSRRGRFVEVIADGRLVGSVQWDHGGKWIAKAPDAHAVWFTDQHEAAAFVAETFAANRARWQAALERAIADGLDPMEISGKWGAWAVESGSRAGVVYLVTENGFRCTCPAGAVGQTCKHKACVRFAAGLLKVYGLEVDGDPEPPAGPACRACDGNGVIHHERLDAQRGPWTCPCCGGTGSAAAA